MVVYVDSCFPERYLADNTSRAIVFASDSNTKLETWSHKELLHYSNRIAHALIHEMKVEVGERIGICMPMSPESVAIYLGIVKAGCAVVSIADSFSSQEIHTRMSLSKAKVFIECICCVM